jgi:hypothetical protein
VDVRLIVAAAGFSDRSDARATSSFGITTQFAQPKVTAHCAVPGGGSCSNEFADTVKTTAASGYSSNVTLEVVASAIGPAFASAYLDPRFYIAPNFADADLYTITLSPGIGNEMVSVNPVPEPASYGVVASALAIAALVRRRLPR